MSILIIKNGLSDTFQDAGRYGFQHLGINPGGAMDLQAMKIANALVGNKSDEAVLEMHFPAAEILFEETTLIALSGGDFDASINQVSLPLLHPIIINKGSLLKFHKQLSGARVYLAIAGGYVLDHWLDSYSTHLQVKAGGFEGRALKKNDCIFFSKIPPIKNQQEPGTFRVLPWKAGNSFQPDANKINFLAGAEYHLLAPLSKQQLEKEAFSILPNSNRMGYRLQGNLLQQTGTAEMISTAVTRGTIQLLPNGQLTILMADHQTTGGYPRVGHVIQASISQLAQMKSGDQFTFQKITLEAAETAMLAQERDLQKLLNACILRLDAFFK